LPPVVQLPATTIYADTSSTASCISDVILHNRAIRQVETSGSTLPEFRITQQTETTGAGIVRRDSVSVSGSVSSRGTASFHTTTRLPTSIDLTSEGRITVTLGVAHTTFLQTSSLTIRQIPRDSLSP
jgi:hypothetical protein